MPKRPPGRSKARVHDLPAIFGARVRERRDELGLTQDALADMAGLHRTYIGSVERGERNVSLWNISRLAVALDCHPGELIPDLRK